MLLKRSLRPEFLNRVDEIVMFKPLNYSEIRDVVQIQLNRVKQMLEEYRLNLVVTENAIDWLTGRGYDPQSGARPVKRLIQKAIVNELSKEIISGALAADNNVIIDADERGLVFIHDKKEEKSLK